MKRLSLSLVVICAFILFPSFANADITHPYVVDEKPQILFGDSIDITTVATTTDGSVATTTYLGLENYKQDYVNGYAHFTFTYTHHKCCYAGYPAVAYVTNVDPRATSTPVEKSYLTITDHHYDEWYRVTDWFLFDVQFDATGFTTTASTEGADIMWTTRSNISNLESGDWLSVANRYPNDAPSQYSMAFTPVPLVEPQPQYAACCSNVLFLPGIEASRLYKTSLLNQVNAENQLWEPNRNVDAEKLFMNPDGISIDSEIYTRDVVDEAYAPTAGPNIYKSFLNTLADMKSFGGIADYSAVPYDWRFSPADVVNRGVRTGENISYIGETNDPYIIKELGRLAASSQTGKVTIVAHSNGGLVTKALMQKLKDENNPLLDKIDKIVFVAVPHLGTPSAIPALLNGYNQGITPFLDAYVARELGQNLPGAYTLLPSAKYFTYVDNPVVQFDASLPGWADKFGPVVHSEELLHNFLLDTFERVESLSQDTDNPSYLRENLLSSAESAHDAYDNWTPPAGIEVVDIAGWGIPTTVSGVKYVKEKDKIKLYPTFSIDGDGTVVTPSALWANGNASTSRYWVDEGLWNIRHPYVLVDPFSIYAKDHKSILDISELNSFIKNNLVLGTDTSLPTYISTSTPIYTGSDRLIYSLHSPLTLDIYDDAGNHTGVSTTTGQIEEQIPGTYFVQFGEVKYFFAGSDIPLHIVMNGYDTGTFTFSIEEKQGDNTVSTVVFKDIPTTPTTKVSMSVVGDMNTLSTLNVDTDGNGSSDIILNPVIGGEVTYTPPAPPTALRTSSTRHPIQTTENGEVAASPIIQVPATITQTVTKVILDRKPQKIIVDKNKPNLNQSALAISSSPQVTSWVSRMWGRAVGWLVSLFK